jgi:hypothetical protein
VLKKRKNFIEIPSKTANYEHICFTWKPCPYTPLVSYLNSKLHK